MPLAQHRPKNCPWLTAPCRARAAQAGHHVWYHRGDHDAELQLLQKCQTAGSAALHGSAGARQFPGSAAATCATPAQPGADCGVVWQVLYRGYFANYHDPTHAVGSWQDHGRIVNMGGVTGFQLLINGHAWRRAAVSPAPSIRCCPSPCLPRRSTGDAAAPRELPRAGAPHVRVPRFAIRLRQHCGATCSELRVRTATRPCHAKVFHS